MVHNVTVTNELGGLWLCCPTTLSLYRPYTWHIGYIGEEQAVHSDG